MNKRRFLNFINNFDLYIGAIILISLTFILTVQVFLRYIFGHAFSWVEEISVILFIWMTYFGVSAASFHGKHLKVDFFIEKLSPKFKKWALFYTDLVTIIFCGYIIFPLLSIIEKFTVSNSKTIILNIPKDMIYYVIIFCLIMTIIRLIQRNIIVLRSEEHDSDSTLDTTGDVRK